MAIKGTNIRSQAITTSSGKDVKDTQMLSGEAGKTPAESAKNDTGGEYSSGSGKAQGPFGGLPSHK